VRFAIRSTAIDRLDLSQDLKEREFEGPSLEDGLLGGFTAGEARWARKAVGIASTAEMDQLEVQLMYFFLAIRREDTTALPAKKFFDLANSDFEIVVHVPVGDPVEGCIQCGRAFEAKVHLQE
jgi:hypothetical protein